MLARTKWFGQGQQSATAEAAQPNPVAILSADAKKFGLENFGNTCYANSVIQALYFCAPFRDLLIQETDPSLAEEPVAPPPPPAPVPTTPIAPVRRKPERTASTYGEPNGNVVLHPPIPGIPLNPPTLFSALRSLFVHIASNPAEKGTVAPRAFIDKLKEFNELFRSTMHQDAHEFLNYLLNKIVEEIEEDRRAGDSGRATPQQEASRSTATLASSQGKPPPIATLVHKLFEGTLTSETRCLTCENVSSRDESFLDLSIDIEQNASVTACLRQFSASEMLCQKNKFFCDVCCDLQEAEKRMKIKKLPNVLALHLKRFKYQEDVQKYIKLAYRVAFPFELRLFNTVDDIDDADRLFNLFGIVIHIGNGPHHGHYISIIKTMGSWLVFDDENVYPITEADIPKYFGESNSGSAYVLYYQAADIDLPALGLRPPPVTIPPPVPVEVSSHLEPSPLLSPIMNPPLPPGLVEDPDLSDTSDPPVPVTPPSPPDSRPAIDISIPAHVEDVAPVSSPSKPKNLFHIRRTPSTSARPPSSSARPSTSGAAEGRRSAPDRSLQSNGASHTSPSDDDAKPLIPPAVPPLPASDKDKRHEPGRKSSKWFGKRKSFRSDKGSLVDEIPPSPVLSSRAAETMSQASSSTWLLTSKHASDKKSRRPSEPGLANGSKTISAAATRPKPTGGALNTKGDHENGMNGYDSPSPGSASSSFVSVGGSTSVSHAAHSVVEFPPPRTSSLAPPPLPPPPLPGPPSPLLTKIPFHKKSLSSLPSPKDKTKSRALPVVDPGPRPATAGASSGGAPDASPPRPLPPLPPLLKELAGQPPPVPFIHVPNGEVPHTPVDTLASETLTMTDEPDPMPPPPASPVALSSLAGTNHSGTSTTSSSGSGGILNHKRASRKMSLTSPLAGLGFGKKDKQHKEKSPSSFNFGKA
ncbi:hypothetical protein FB45DRAFT_327113 [Roridomyces roridus]|uniref:Ubiquitin carboxyl-terminal hydrolase n=1 Tax=Roridomyces roridus TaxID=1738132 RepID=A0AAD7B538_9AGAR|nr:hypothetical protein FB45DRAFT_327113 [Roridomyces roridus]